MKHSRTSAERVDFRGDPQTHWPVSGDAAVPVLDRRIDVRERLRASEDCYRPDDTNTDTSTHTDDTPRLLRAAGGDEWILVVEDDALLRSLAEQILAARGYHVLGAGHAREALALIEQHRSKLSLLLTDVVMPGTNGRELARRALRACPTLPVIYMSGYTDAGATHHGGDTPQAFIGKPFTAVGLLELVRSTLDTAQARARAKTGGE